MSVLVYIHMLEGGCQSLQISLAHGQLQQDGYKRRVLGPEESVGLYWGVGRYISLPMKQCWRSMWLAWSAAAMLLPAVYVCIGSIEAVQCAHVLVWKTPTLEHVGLSLLIVYFLPDINKTLVSAAQGPRVQHTTNVH